MVYSLDFRWRIVSLMFMYGVDVEFLRHPNEKDENEKKRRPFFPLFSTFFSLQSGKKNTSETPSKYFVQFNSHPTERLDRYDKNKLANFINLKSFLLSILQCFSGGL